MKKVSKSLKSPYGGEATDWLFRQHRSQAKKGPAEWQKGGFELSISIFQIKCSMPLGNTGSTKFFPFPIFFFPFFSEEGRLKFPRLRLFNPLNIPFFTFPVNEK